MIARDVALCSLTDEDYGVGLLALLKSLRTHHPDLAVPFLVYHGTPLSAKLERDLRRAYEPLSLSPIDVAPYSKCLFSSYRAWGVSPAWRYEIFRENAFEQLVYIDADMLVQGDITPLLEFRGALAACPLPPGEGMELRAMGGFNAGLMSIGRSLRTPETWQALLQVAESRPWSGNQTVLNIVLGKYLQPLSNIFNLTTCEVTQDNLAAARILHYVGWQKPWHEPAFDPYQREKAGDIVCEALLQRWLQYAPDTPASP
ncbi:MAG: glycosyltransferase [Rhodocyclaceae bacterium]